jgi:predicted nucleic acid-binding protein
MLATYDAVVPEIWAFEIANSTSVSFNKRKRITETQIEQYLHLLKALPIRLEARDLWLTVDLEAPSRRWNLTPYDAAYLDLALRRRLPLATTDDDLKGVALAEAIEVLSESRTTPKRP